MSDIRTVYRGFELGADLALRTRRVKRKVKPGLKLDFINDWDAAVAYIQAHGGFTRAGDTATRVNEQGFIEAVAADTPRRDFDPQTKAARGILLEESRANLLRESNSVTTAPWAGAAIAVQDASGVDGDLSAWTVTDDSPVIFQSRAQAVVVPNDAATYVFSIYVKKSAASNTFGFNLNLSGGVAASVGPRLNANSGQHTGVGGAIDCGDFWLFWYPITNNATGNTNLSVSFFPATSTNVGDNPGPDAAAATGSHVVCEPQLEVCPLGAFPTSRIRTAAVAVARNVDVPKLTDIIGFFNEVEGVIVVEASQPVLTDKFCPLVYPNAGGGERLDLGFSGTPANGGPGRITVADGGVIQADFTVNGTINAAQVYRLALAYKANDIALYRDGALGGSDNSATLPSPTQIDIGQRNNAESLNGHLRSLTYYPVRLKNDSLQALSVPGAQLATIELDEEVEIIDGLDEDDGIETAVVLSLFTDRRAEPGDALPDGAAGRRGWWGDQFPAVEGDRFGSRLWLLSREKQVLAVLARAREYAEESLRWMVDDGIARSVKASAEVVSNGVLGLTIEIARSDMPVAQYRFDTFWKGA